MKGKKETMCWYLFYNTGIMLITAIYLRYNYMQPYMIAPKFLLLWRLLRQRLPCCLPIGSQSRKLFSMQSSMQASSNKQVNLQIWRGLSRTSTPLMLSKFKRSPRCGSECWFRWVNTLLNLPYMFLPNRSSAKPNICPASICHWINSHLIGITEVWTKTKTFCRFLLINYLL